MEKTNFTEEQFHTLLSSRALQHSLSSWSLTKALEEEVSEFISKSTNESKEEVVKRIRERSVIISKNLAHSLAEELGIPPEKIEHLF